MNSGQVVDRGNMLWTEGKYTEFEPVESRQPAWATELMAGYY